MTELTTVTQQPFEVTCADGVMLKGLLLVPEQPKGVIQFHCGTGTKKEIYLAMLTWLASKGYIACLWDYRGSGESAPADMKNCTYVFSDYGLKDMPAVKNELQKRYPDLPFFLMGHSAGGQQVGLMDDLTGVKGMVNFAVSTGYFPNMPWGYRLKAYFFFYMFAPLSKKVNGYIKSKPYGFMENLPAGVVKEWGQWCAQKDYLFSTRFMGKTIPQGHFKQYTFPIHVFWTTDDTISNENNTRGYWKHVKGVMPITFTRLNPTEWGVKKIGHFGFFRKQMKETLWPHVLKKLEDFYTHTA